MTADMTLTWAQVHACLAAKYGKRAFDALDDLLCATIGSERLLDDAAVADEIVRLRAQVEHAHAILASEGAAWLVVGSNHERSWRQSLTPAIQSYWDKYGNYFKEANRG